ncbi:MAG: DUF1659 domain-containing protein [Bacillus sp. (in: firmicutes)]
MASEILESKSLALEMIEGMNDKGTPIVKRYTYSNISPTASADSLLAAATALSGLYKGTVRDFLTIDTQALSN